MDDDNETGEPALEVIDGWDAAVFVQRIKALMETPATIFID